MLLLSCAETFSKLPLCVKLSSALRSGKLSQCGMIVCSQHTFAPRDGGRSCNHRVSVYTAQISSRNLYRHNAAMLHTSKLYSSSHRSSEESMISEELAAQLIKQNVNSNFSSEFLLPRLERLGGWASEQLADEDFSELSKYTDEKELERLKSAIESLDKSTKEWLEIRNCDVLSNTLLPYCFYNDEDASIRIGMQSTGYHARYSVFKPHKKRFTCIYWVKFDLHPADKSEKWPITISSIQYYQFMKQIL